MKLRQEHIAEEWDEGRPKDGGDGYWIFLKSGWKWDGDPMGNCHIIHEDTKQEARNQDVLKCECKECKMH